MQPTEDLTGLLNYWAGSARPEALDRVIEKVFSELKQIARHRLAQGSAEMSLQPTELVHEAYLRLRRVEVQGFQDRSHFFALASRLIRTILVDHARERGAAKRGGEHQDLRLDGIAEPGIELDLDRALMLDEALKRLEDRHPRQGRVAELRLFGGLTMPEIADAVSSSQPTVERDWRLGRRRLVRELQTL